MNDKKKRATETSTTDGDSKSLLHARELAVPVTDRFEYEQQMSDLPDGEQNLAIEVTRLADLSRYFWEKEMQVPPHIYRQIIDLRKLEVPQRIEKMREINEELMEYLHSVSEDSEFRM
jgi:uncharacterized protein with von Willebrand factor type A (vWA) domain